MDSDYTIARYYNKGKRFEILVDPDKALEYKMGKREDMKGILMFETVYSDSKKGMKASQEDLLEVFKTLNIEEITEKIIKMGELPLKTEQRRTLIEEKRKQIINYISRHCIDTRTNVPIPPIRIEKVLEEIGSKITPFQSAEEQAPEIIKALTAVIPIRQQTSTFLVKIPAIYVGKAYGFLKNLGGISEEEWLSNGSYTAKVSLPAGLSTHLTERLGEITKGSALIEIFT